MKEKELYSDKLIIITKDKITLKNYYPIFISKKIYLKDISKIETIVPTLRFGKWRLWGSGNFMIWFPLDMKRPIRDKIFILKYKNQKISSGFTAENSESVEKILRERGIVFSSSIR